MLNLDPEGFSDSEKEPIDPDSPEAAEMDEGTPHVFGKALNKRVYLDSYKSARQRNKFKIWAISRWGNAILFSAAFVTLIAITLVIREWVAYEQEVEKRAAMAASRVLDGSLAPFNPPPERQERMDAEAEANLAAFDLYKNGQLTECESLLRAFLTENEGNSTTWSNLGKVQAERSNLVGAEFSFSKALQINPKDEPTLFNLALVLKRQKKFASVVQIIEEVAGPEPKTELLFLLWGLSRVDNGAQMFSFFNEIEERIRIDPPPGRWLILASAILYQTGNTEGAFAVFNSARNLIEPTSLAYLLQSEPFVRDLHLINKAPLYPPLEKTVTMPFTILPQ